MFDELPVFHSGRTQGHASPAIEAFVKVIDKRTGDPKVILLHMDYLVNPAAWRIRFEIP